MYEEILFNSPYKDSMDIKAIKLDDFYHLRPSVYKVDGESVTNHLEVDDYMTDMFDSMFLNTATNLLTKKLALDKVNIFDLVISVLTYELKMVLDVTEENMYRFDGYLDAIQFQLDEKFKRLGDDVSDILDISFWFQGDKEHSYIILGR